MHLQQSVLANLADLSCRPGQLVRPTEAAALRARLKRLFAQAGRTLDTSCTICLEPLEQPVGGTEKGGGVRGADGDTNSCVLVLLCNHQFHLDCLTTWWRTRSDQACPLCKK